MVSRYVTAGVQRRRLATALALALLIGLLAPSNAQACGGFFCDTVPVNQAAEQIVFTVNDDGTITSLIEIQYSGEAPSFSWILPLPEAISAEDISVPDDGGAVFDELRTLTDLQFIPPDEERCGPRWGSDNFRDVSNQLPSGSPGGVTNFASGEVGPFGFDVIGAEDPDALTSWLRDNGYRVEPEMEPLIDVYVEEGHAFLAMRLRDGETSDSISPVEITYPATQPMIPLRLTAVAAEANMLIYTWIYADEQAVPVNYEHFTIKTEELTFFTDGFAGNDYQSLVRLRADANDGRAWITEYAAPASELRDMTEPYLLARSDRYLTRLATVISPAEMTIDPEFKIANRPDVSNVRDASDMSGLYACERAGEMRWSPVNFLFGPDAIDPGTTGGAVTAAPRSSPVGAWPYVALLLAVAGGWVLRRRHNRPDPMYRYRYSEQGDAQTA